MDLGLHNELTRSSTTNLPRQTDRELSHHNGYLKVPTYHHSISRNIISITHYNTFITRLQVN